MAQNRIEADEVRWDGLGGWSEHVSAERRARSCRAGAGGADGASDADSRRGGGGGGDPRQPSRARAMHRLSPPRRTTARVRPSAPPPPTPTPTPSSRPSRRGVRGVALPAPKRTVALARAWGLSARDGGGGAGGRVRTDGQASRRRGAGLEGPGAGGCGRGRGLRGDGPPSPS